MALRAAAAAELGAFCCCCCCMALARSRARSISRLGFAPPIAARGEGFVAEAIAEAAEAEAEAPAMVVVAAAREVISSEMLLLDVEPTAPATPWCFNNL